MSAAIKQLEQQLGVKLLERTGRGIAVTPAGEVLRGHGRELLEHADFVVDAVTARGRSATGRLRLGVSPTARYGIAPALLAACAVEAAGVMIYTTEDTTGALARDVARGDLDMAITFCAPGRGQWRRAVLLREEPAVVHLPAGHGSPRVRGHAARSRRETILVASSHDSVGFTARILMRSPAWNHAPDPSGSVP